ncbi:MAG: response regulator [Chloroflexota bacterium]
MEKIRVLIVDDEPDFVTSLEAMLIARGFQVAATSDRSRAQTLSHREKPDLVVVGTIMPRGEAFQLHHWFKRNPTLADTPLIVVDAPEEKQVLKGWWRDEAMQLESEGYFRKPVEPSVLISRIEKVLDRITRKIKVLVVDDHAVVREGLRALIGLQRDMQVVGEAIEGREAVQKTQQLLPDIVLMDIVMPGLSGLEATKQICRECKYSRVLMLTQYDDEENALASKQAGAMGFIPKRSASSELLSAIRSASRG